MKNDLLDDLKRAAIQANDHGKLRGYEEVIVALSKYARLSGASEDVLGLLGFFLGDIQNLMEGRPLAGNVAPERKPDLSQPRQHILVWAAASKWIDYQSNKKEAAVQVERRLLAAGYPLPANAVHGSGVAGQSISAWRKHRNAKRKTGETEELFGVIKAMIDDFTASGLTQEQASEEMFDATLKLFK